MKRRSLTVTVSLAVSCVLTSCTSLIGITGDYFVADAGRESTADGPAVGDTGSLGEPSVEASGPMDGGDGSVVRDGSDANDSADVISNETSEEAPLGCPSGQVLCLAKCVNLATDSDNCGQCGTTCATTAPSTASCTAGYCVVQLMPSTAAASIAIDDQNLYATDLGMPGNVTRVPKAGGVSSTIASNQPLPLQIGTDGVNVYWGNTANPGGGVLRCPVTGCVTPTELTSAAMPDDTLPSSGALDFAVLGGSVLWATGQGELYECATGGCGESPTLLGVGIVQNRGIVTYPGQLLWASFGVGGPAGVFSESTAANSDGGLTDLALDTPVSLAISGDTLFWGSAQTGQITTCTMPSCDPTPLLPGTYVAGTGAGYNPIATDGVSVYWSNQSTLYKCPVGGCTTPTVLFVLDGLIYDIQVDATSVYIANGSAGARRVTPK